MRIIINADDLGINREVSERILSLMSRGLLTSATMMANGKDVEWASTEAAKYPNCSFGAHLNLTEFLPLTDHQELRSILDDQRGFVYNRIREVKNTVALREAVYNEWCAQIDRLLSLGVKVSHLDSHHHTHTVPGLFWPLKRVQKKYGIRKVRLTKNVFFRDRVSNLSSLRKASWNFFLRHFYQTKTTDGFTSFKDFYQMLRDGRVMKHESLELMTHPGAAAYEDETRLLEEKWQNEAKGNIELISYNDL